jgi:hypothetical protein
MMPMDASEQSVAYATMVIEAMRSRRWRAAAEGSSARSSASLRHGRHPSAGGGESKAYIAIPGGGWLHHQISVFLQE